MATATPTTYTVVSGATIYAGRTNTPAWLSGKPLNEIFAIPNTSGAGGSAVDAYSGWTFKPDTGDIIIPLAGGHLDSSDNSVNKINLYTDTPSWSQIHAPSPSVTANAAYNPDGQPSSRHTYGHAHWSSVRNRVMMLGGRFLYGGGVVQSPKVDGFNLSTNTWEAAGTFSDAPAGWYGEVLDSNGDGWTFLTPALGGRKWTASTDTWSNTNISTVPTGWVRRPWVLDTLRGTLFGLAYGDGEGDAAAAPVQVNAARFNPATNIMEAISFNSSVALTQFNADTPTYSGMDYDSVNDKFFFYCGQGSGAGRMYVITPNSGTTWDMSILSLGGGTITPTATPNSGINSKFTYVPSLKGFVFLPRASSNLNFIRTA